MRIREPNRRQVVSEAGAAMAVAFTPTDSSTAQELRPSGIVYPMHHWEVLEPSAAGCAVSQMWRALPLCPRKPTLLAHVGTSPLGQ
jgi:hypothetical protein